MVRSTGQVLCADSNSHGQLGVGLREPSTDPVNGLPPIQQVAVAAHHVCARSRRRLLLGAKKACRRRIITVIESIKVVAWAKRYAALPLQVVFD